MATLLALALFAMLPPGTAALASVAAKEIRVEEVRTEIGDNAVAYPQLEGMEDESVQKKINDDIVLSGDIASHFITLSTLSARQNGALGLRVSHESYLAADVFSTVISAKGKMPTGRDGHAYAALSYDLKTGERLTLADFFTDVNAAVSGMEQIAEQSLSEELSSYMEHGEILPLPTASFAFDQDGVSFYYPAEQFLLLSGYCGACQFDYEELSPYLRTDPEGVLARIGALPEEYTPKRARELITQAVSDGTLPHVPATLGEPMAELVNKYRLLRTPDEFPGGRYFALEAPAFRDTFLISDTVESGYERSVLEGIQRRRGSLYGLLIGSAKREEWLAVLGQPEEIMAFSENMAYDYSLPVGQSDIYHFGGHELRLHADEEGTLRCVQLGK